MPAATHLMTVADFSGLPEDSGPVYHELRGGELVSVPRPKLKHYLIQENIRDILKPIVPEGSRVGPEFAFRPVSEYELRVADVAWVSASRWSSIDPEGYFRGVPELVVEVLSPSNTAAQLEVFAKLCLQNGALEFWIVNPDRRSVQVTGTDGRTRIYSEGERIPLDFVASGHSVLVNEFFAGIS